MEDIAKLFEKEIHKSYDKLLEEYGFKCIKSEADGSGFNVVFRDEKRYILIGASLKEEDYPYYFYISFGEGSDEMPESEWNAVAFWRIMQSVSPDDYKKYLHIFEISIAIREEQIAEIIRGSSELCKICGSEFLTGDLSLFRAVRAEQNRDREPYKIYQLGPDGKHKLIYEEQSVALKEKYSQVEIPEESTPSPSEPSADTASENLSKTVLLPVD